MQPDTRGMYIAVLLGVACRAPLPASNPPPAASNPPPAASNPPPAASNPPPAASNPPPVSNSPPPAPQTASWRDAYDLDGDGTNDRIISEFTGGGHCCYRIGAALSSTGMSIVFPFDMDGGYPRGLDLGQPDRFTVRTRDSGLPEIIYQIATYNGEPQPLEPGEAKRWGIRSHRIVLCFAGGNPRAHDEAPDLPPCKR